MFVAVVHRENSAQGNLATNPLPSEITMPTWTAMQLSSLKTSNLCEQAMNIRADNSWNVTPLPKSPHFRIA